MSDSLRPCGLQHARPPCPSPTPGVYSSSCPLSRWCHPTVSCSVVPFSSRLQSFLASGSFPVSQFFASGGQSIGVSASASVLLMNIQVWFHLGWTGWISLQSKGLSRVFFNTTVQSIDSLALSFLYNAILTSIHYYWKTIALTRGTFVGKVMSLLFNMLSRLVITFLPRSQFFVSGGQSTGVSASVSVLPMNIQDWFPLRFTDLLAVPGTLKSLLQHNSKASVLWCSAFFIVQLSHPYMTTKIIALTRQTFVSKVM